MVAAVSVVARAGPSGPASELADLIHHVVRSSLHRLHPTLEEEGITMGQFWALHLVSALAGASVGGVARHLGVSAPTACASLDQLETAGLVRRHRSERDRRSVVLSVTPRGRRVEARVWAEVARLMAGASEGVSTDDLAVTVRVFRELAGRLAAPGAPPEGP